MAIDTGYAGLGGALFAIIGIWSTVGLGVYVWYLWALARLFPYLGLPAAHGWIPVWNQWRLIERGGLPGWTAILVLVPGLNVVVLVVSIIAIHRINQEEGEGAGMTVLGAFVPPLWATLLGSRLRDRGYATGQFPGVSPRGQGLVEYGADGQVYPLLSGSGPAAGQPQFTMPAVPPTFGAPEARPGSQPPPRSVPAVPVPHVAEPFQAAGAPIAPQENPWGLGNTTEGNFQRLASEAAPSREASFGGGNDARPFSWPEPAPLAPEAPIVPAPMASQQGGAEPTRATYPEWVPAAQAMQAAAKAGLSAQSEADVAAGAELEHDYGAVSDVAPEPVRVAFAEPDIAPADLRPVLLPEPEGASAPAASPVADASPEAWAESGDGDGDEDFDRTVVVSRRELWVLELPDGEEVELESNDSVVGRKPTAIEGSAVLVIPDATRTLSKSHARFRRVDDGWTVEDLDSTNGVFTIDAQGIETELSPGVAVQASEHLILGTLSVRLRRSE